MNDVEILENLSEIFREFFDDGEIVLSNVTTAEDIEDWDSLAQEALILSIEKTFSLKLSATEVGKLENVG